MGKIQSLFASRCGTCGTPPHFIGHGTNHGPWFAQLCCPRGSICVYEILIYSGKEGKSKFQLSFLGFSLNISGTCFCFYFFGMLVCLSIEGLEGKIHRTPATISGKNVRFHVVFVFNQSSDSIATGGEPAVAEVRLVSCFQQFVLSKWPAPSASHRIYWSTNEGYPPKYNCIY